MFFPAAAVEIIDTWDSTGLRGTASHDYAVADVFVPEYRSLWFSDRPAATTPFIGCRWSGSFYIRDAVPLGVSRHALDAFMTLAAAKTSTSSTTRMADKPTVQAGLDRAATLILTARASLVGTLHDLWEKIQSGEQPTLADHRGLWLTATHSAQAGFEATEMLYAMAGSTGVYATSPLDRCLRDARTAVQDIVLPEANYEHYGRELLVGDTMPGPWILDYRNTRRSSP